MKVLARLPAVPPLAPYEPALLLEGSWPECEAASNRWSLDEAIDARQGWVDEEAERLAAQLEEQASTPVWSTFIELNQLKLRYFLVKLLRPVAFFRRHEVAGDRIDLNLSSETDDVYAALFSSLTRVRGWSLSVGTMGIPARRGLVGQKCPTYKARWRRWAASAAKRLAGRGENLDGPLIAFCGNRRLLGGVCNELLRRGCRGAWLYEQFAVKTFLRWRGVRQWTCDGPPPIAPDGLCEPPLAAPIVTRGVDLTPALKLWLERSARASAARQQRWLAALTTHFHRCRPAAVVLDEDATPFARAAIHVARRFGVPSIVVQHGAPRVRFGFAPAAADLFCAWGESSRRQLLAWGAADDQVQVTGAPFDPPPGPSKIRRANGDTQAIEVLLLATTPPSDARPDVVSFHLTTATHEQMLRLACRAVERTPGARLTVKLHPRCRDRECFARILAEFPSLWSRIVARRSLANCLAIADCVLNCTSSAGIEAAQAGLPVIELIPDGGDDLLPGMEWGGLGTARNEAELDELLQRALDQRGSQGHCRPSNDVFAAVGAEAAARVADVVLGECDARRGVVPFKASSAHSSSVAWPAWTEEVAA